MRLDRPSGLTLVRCRPGQGVPATSKKYAIMRDRPRDDPASPSVEVSSLMIRPAGNDTQNRPPNLRWTPEPPMKKRQEKRKTKTKKL